MIRSQSQIIDTGVLVKLKDGMLLCVSEDRDINPGIGLVTNVRPASGMFERIAYALVLWENGTHLEHYISDLEKVEQ